MLYLTLGAASEVVVMKVALDFHPFPKILSTMILSTIDDQHLLCIGVLVSYQYLDLDNARGRLHTCRSLSGLRYSSKVLYSIRYLMWEGSTVGERNKRRRLDFAYPIRTILTQSEHLLLSGIRRMTSGGSQGCLSQFQLKSDFWYEIASLLYAKSEKKEHQGIKHLSQ